MKTKILGIILIILAVNMVTTGCMGQDTTSIYGQAIISGVVSGVFTVVGVMITLFAGKKTFTRQMGIQNTPLLTAYLKSREEHTHKLQLDITDADDMLTPTKIRAQSLALDADSSVTICFKNNGNGTAKDIEYGSVEVETGEHLFNQKELKRLYRHTPPRRIETLHAHPHHLIKSNNLELQIHYDSNVDFSHVVMVHLKDIIDNRHLQKVLVEKRDKTIYLYPISEDFYR